MSQLGGMGVLLVVKGVEGSVYPIKRDTDFKPYSQHLDQEASKEEFGPMPHTGHEIGNVYAEYKSIPAQVGDFCGSKPDADASIKLSLV